MSVIKRATTMDEYIELVNQALFEVEELRMSVEYDMKFMEDAIGFIDPLISIVEREPNVILPFKTLLRQINEIHREGLLGVNEA